MASFFWLFTIFSAWTAASLNQKLGSLRLVLLWWVGGMGILFDLWVLNGDCSYQTRASMLGLVLGGTVGFQVGLQQFRGKRQSQAVLDPVTDPSQGFVLVQGSRRHH